MSERGEDLENLSVEKRILLLRRLRDKRARAASLQIPARQRQGDTFPLSFAQQRLWFLHQLEPDNPIYNLPIACRIFGQLNIAALQESFDAVIRRHEILRTSFIIINGRPFQAISDPAPLQSEVIDLSHLPESERETRSERQLREIARRAFDLRHGPMLRTALVKLSQQEFLLMVVMHHIISDGWSLEVFIQEASAIYEAKARGKEAELPGLPIQYADYAVWQQDYLQGEEMERLVDYWRQHLIGAPPILKLPTDRPRPVVQSYRGARQSLQVPATLLDALNALSRAEGVTTFMIMLAAVGTLFHRFTGQESIVVGVPVAGRNRSQLEKLIGLFVNTLALRLEDLGSLTFQELLAQVKEVSLNAYTHQDLPFEKLVEVIKPERDLSYAPIFQVMFNLINKGGDLGMADLSLTPIEVTTSTVKFDMSVVVVEADSGLTVSIDYSTDLFDAETIARMLGCLHSLLNGVVANPREQVSKLPLLTEAEKRRLLVEWNNSAAEFPEDVCFHQLFELQVERSPEAVAVVSEGERLTYDMLNRRANRLAGFLLEQGVGPDVVVALLAERGVDLLAAIIAVFKSGGAYLPLDLHQPPKRILQILSQSTIPLVLVARKSLSLVTDALEGMPFESRPTVAVIEDLVEQRRDESNPPSGALPQNLAYVIYTSGSTGLPKGAMVEHRGMLNHLFAKISDLELMGSDIIAQTASQCFDISVWQFLSALLRGGRVHIFSDEVAHDGARLLEQVEENGVSILEIVPSLLRTMLDADLFRPGVSPSSPDGEKRMDRSALRWMIMTGEALPPELCRRWLGRYPHVPMMNAYGPTECSDDVTHYPIYTPPPAHVVKMSIGRPIANIQIYICDEELQPVPIGVAGELLVGGIGVGRGYLNDPDRTKNSFIEDPFAGKAGARLYKTGDLARRLADGNIEFIGRMDYQVKVRGFRIELGEIEAALGQHAGVREAVVIASEVTPGDKQLVAYFVQKSDAEAAAADLRAFLKQRLPDYMIPAVFVKLEAIPLTPNGKVDARALPAPEGRRIETDEPFSELRSDLEYFLLKMWNGILNLERISVDDNFFDLGGDSIKGAIFINQLQEELCEIVYVAALFSAPTIAGFARYLNENYQSAVARLLHSSDGLARADRDEHGPGGDNGINSSKVEQMRQLIKPLPTGQPFKLATQPKNPTAIFILSPPRSGSTLLRVMLGGHPLLLAPQELELLSFDTLEDRKSALSGRDSFWLEGTTRAIMQIKGCDADQAKSLMQYYEEMKLPTRQFYGLVQQWIGDKRLVDKTPSYALDSEILKRAETDFDNALYIHLLRHPCAMVSSYVEAKLVQIFPRFKHPFSAQECAELIWLISHQNILKFLERVPRGRQIRVGFEELVGRPEAVMRRLCQFLGIDFDPEMMQPYKDKRARMTDGVHEVSHMLGDMKFHQHTEIDSHAAERWKQFRAEISLGDITWDVAELLGYEREASGAGIPGRYAQAATGRPDHTAAIQNHRSSGDEITAACAGERAGAWNLTEERPGPAEPEIIAGMKPAQDFSQHIQETSNLTECQFLSWFGQRHPADKQLYFDSIITTLDIHGEVDITHFRRAFQKLVDNSDSLRSVIYEVDEIPERMVLEYLTFQVDYVDLSASANIRSAFEAWLNEHSQARFDFGRRLFDAALLKVGPDHYVWYLKVHHILADSWSVWLMLRQVSNYYASSLEGRLESEEATFAYQDYVDYLQAYRQSASWRNDEAYWKDKLSRSFAASPLYDNNPPTHMASTERIVCELGEERSRKVKELASREGVFSPSIVFETVLFAYLHRVTGESDLGIGAAFANRTNAFKSTVGMFVNSCPLLVHVSESDTFISLLRKVQTENIRTARHQSYTIRNPARKRVYDVYFNYQNATVTNFCGLPVEFNVKLCGDYHPSLAIQVEDFAGRNHFVLDFDFDCGSFDESQRQNTVAHYLNLLDRFLDDGDESLRLVNMVSGADNKVGKEALSVPGQANEAQSKARAITRRKRGEEPVALSFAQQRLWFLDQLLPSKAAYNMPLAVRITGPLDIKVVKQAYGEIIRRHEVLRTTFPAINGSPYQAIAPARPFDLSLIDLSSLSEEYKKGSNSRLVDELAQRPFDLAQGPLMQVSLLRLSEQEHILLSVLHHIISDGWSTGILIRELASLYESLSEDKPSPLADLPIQYADFAIWQRERLKEGELETELAYWKKQLGGIPSLLHLPLDRHRPSEQTTGGAAEKLMLSEELSGGLRLICRQQGSTLFMILMAAFKALLFRYTGQTTIAVGTPIAGRNRPELEDLIGLFTNTLVLRTDLSGDLSFLALLGQVRAAAIEVFTHQELPFELLVEALRPQRDLSHNPLFQVMMVFQNTPSPGVEIAGLTMTVLDRESKSAKFDLTLTFTETPRGITGTIKYRTALFDKSTIARMTTHLKALLESIVANPDQQLWQLEMMQESERRHLLVDRNQTHAAFPEQVCLHEMVEAQAKRAPETIAVVYGKEGISYAELNRRANQLANYLRRLSVGPEVRVVICAERSAEMVIGVLGILKAGGVYVPLDPAYPRNRKALILEETKTPVVLTQLSLISILPEHKAMQVCLDADYEILSREGEEDPRGTAGSENLAYIIYTSGSTGKPKGVMMSHHAICNHLFWRQSCFPLSPGDSFLHKASLSFDISVWEIFGTLMAGARLIIAGAGKEGDPDYLVSLIVEHGITEAHFGPSMLKAFLEDPRAADCKSLKRVFCGGEPLPLRVREEFFSLLDAGLYNQYGPTETCVDVLIWDCRRESNRESVPIGQPIFNTQAYVLDGSLQPAPINVPGELHIAGHSLSRGYFNLPELTAERFIPSPFGGQPGARLYKTGDLVRYLSDGSIDFLGRIDNQVKIRGFRVELGEIEAVVRQHPSIRECVVIASDDIADHKRLVLYVVVDRQRDLTKDDLRGFLQQHLASYMIPSAIIMLDSMPLTLNGKLDKRGLPAPDQTGVEPGSFAAPRNPNEKLLAGIWAKTLNLQQVGIHDNFFLIGGDSILSIQAVARANKAGLRLTPHQIFKHQTIAALAAAANDDQSPEADQGSVTGMVPLTPVQHWFFDRNFVDPHHWNTSLMIESGQPLHPSLMKEAVEKLLAHHDALRLRFRQSESGWQQYCVGIEPQQVFSCIDLSELSEPEQKMRIENAASELQASLNLSEGPLARFALFETDRGKPNYLLIIIHHLVIDGMSRRILLEDLNSAYEDLSLGRPIHLPRKTTSYQQWARRLNEYAQSETIQEESSYWLSEPRASGYVLPVDFTNGENVRGSARTVSKSLSVEQTRRMVKEVPAAHDTQVNDLLLTAYAVTISSWVGRRHLLVGTVNHGRSPLFEDVDLSRTVGWINIHVPLLLDLSGANDIAGALQAVKEQLRRLPHNGIDYSLLRYLNRDEEIAGKIRSQPEPEIGFNYLGQIDPVLSAASPFKLAQYSAGLVYSRLGQRPYVVDLFSLIYGGQLRMNWYYSENLHRRDTIEALAEKFIESLLSLIELCMSKPGNQALTKASHIEPGG